jgi:hypothetical protein
MQGTGRIRPRTVLINYIDDANSVPAMGMSRIQMSSPGLYNAVCEPEVSFSQCRLLLLRHRNWLPKRRRRRLLLHGSSISKHLHSLALA